MISHPCIPCQHGRHEDHHDVVDPGIEGLIGSGWSCPCRGECVENYRPPEIITVTMSDEDRQAWAKFEELMEGIDD